MVEKTGDSLIGEEIVSNFSTKKAHTILGIKNNKEHFMPYSYSLNKKQAAFFQEDVKHTFDFRKYAYFISGIAEVDDNQVEETENRIRGAFSKKAQSSKNLPFKPAPRILKAFPNAVRVKPKTSV